MTTIHNGGAALSDVGRLVLHGPDQPGIVATVSGLLHGAGANIETLDQYSSPDDRFFQRTVFHLPDLALRAEDLRDQIAGKIGTDLGLTWQLVQADRLKRVAILVSRHDHCLLDLLWRHRRGQIPMSLQMVISNHPDLSEEVRRFGIPYIHVPVTGAGKAAAEAEQLRLLRGNVDLVVLARYMQILSGDFLDQIDAPIINIHHSFLPAFMGASPYQRARERGVKLIGATAHYATVDLDEGPIIEQDVVRVTHELTARELQDRGADVERQVLSRAVTWHLEDRVICDGGTTVVF